jgi:hypothetical protein
MVHVMDSQVLLGDLGSGKTSIVVRFAKGLYYECQARISLFERLYNDNHQCYKSVQIKSLIEVTAWGLINIMFSSRRSEPPSSRRCWPWTQPPWSSTSGTPPARSATAAIVVFDISREVVGGLSSRSASSGWIGSLVGLSVCTLWISKLSCRNVHAHKISSNKLFFLFRGLGLVH